MLLESALYPWVEWREFIGNFYTPTCCFLYLEISVDLNGNLWRQSEFQNFDWESLATIREFRSIQKKEKERFIVLNKRCKPFPLHPWYRRGCICTYIQMYAHTHTHIHTYRRRRDRSGLMYIHTHTRVHTYVQTHTHLHIHTGEDASAAALRIHTRTHTYTHMHTHTHTHSHSHTHT